MAPRSRSRVSPDSQLEELPPSDDTMLKASELGDREINMPPKRTWAG